MTISMIPVFVIFFIKCSNKNLSMKSYIKQITTKLFFNEVCRIKINIVQININEVRYGENFRLKKSVCKSHQRTQQNRSTLFFYFVFKCSKFQPYRCLYRTDVHVTVHLHEVEMALCW